MFVKIVFISKENVNPRPFLIFQNSCVTQCSKKVVFNCILYLRLSSTPVLRTKYPCRNFDGMILGWGYGVLAVTGLVLRDLVPHRHRDLSTRLRALRLLLLPPRIPALARFRRKSQGSLEHCARNGETKWNPGPRDACSN